MLKLKKMIIVAIITIAASSLMIMGTEVKATTDNPIDMSNSIDIFTNMYDEPTTNEVANETVNETVNETTNNTQIIQPNVNTVNNNNIMENTLPKTGVTEDITVMFFIIVCAISAVYAYRKIRDYNV